MVVEATAVGATAVEKAVEATAVVTGADKGLEVMAADVAMVAKIVQNNRWFG